MNHLPDKHLFRTLFFLLCLLLSVSNKSFSQTKSSYPSINRELLIIKDELVKTSFIPQTSCSASSFSSFENLVANAVTCNSQGNWPCCKTILQSVLQNQQNLTALQLCHLHLAWAAYYTLHQGYDSAYYYAALAGKEAGEQKLKYEKAEALLLLSAESLKQRNISFAYACADSALIIARQTGNDALEGKSLLQFALCTRRHFTALAKRSFPYFLKAREKAIATRDSVTLATTDMYLSSDYFELNKWSEGLSYLKEGIQLSGNNNNFQLLYLSYTVFGYAFELTENYRNALSSFIKALNLSQSQQQPYNVQHCYHDISRCYQGLHQYDSALVFANFAGNVPGVDSFYANVWETKAAIYNDMGDYKIASSMFMKSIDWFREDFLFRNQDQLSGYEAKLNTKEKEIQVTQQKKRALELEWMIGAVGGLLLIATWAFIVQRKARRKLMLQNMLIQKQQTELEKSLGEKDLLLKEVHHRVKNNLSVISSLLEMQSNGIIDENAKAAMAVAQNRISSIALIHQRLYQHENLSTIELHEFLLDLSKKVGSLFKKPGEQILLEISVPELFVDIDTAIPLGLIMNELLTNSYKHAFNKHNNGLIKINLQQQNKDDFLLTYSDNGPGISNDINIEKSTSLGLRLIHRLSKQIGGTANYQYLNGSTFVINFKNYFTGNHEDE